MTPEYADGKFVRVASYKSRWDAPSFNAMCTRDLNLPCLPVETPYSQINEQVLTCEDYLEIGARMAKAVLDAVAAGKHT